MQNDFKSFTFPPPPSFKAYSLEPQRVRGWGETAAGPGSRARSRLSASAAPAALQRHGSWLASKHRREDPEMDSGQPSRTPPSTPTLPEPSAPGGRRALRPELPLTARPGLAPRRKRAPGRGPRHSSGAAAPPARALAHDIRRRAGDPGGGASSSPPPFPPPQPHSRSPILSEGQTALSPGVCGAIGPSSKSTHGEESLPPGWTPKGLHSVSSVPDGSRVGHFHSVPSPGAERHLFSINLEAEANPGLYVAGIARHSHTRPRS